MGDNCKQRLYLTDNFSPEDLKNTASSFVSNWYKKVDGFDLGGFYFISYTTIDGTPVIVS